MSWRDSIRDVLTLAAIAVVTYFSMGTAAPAASAFFGAFAARGAILVGIQAYARSQARRAARRSAREPSDNFMMLRSVDHPEIVVYGMCRVPTVLAARFAHGEGNKFNTLIVKVPCRHRLAGIERVLFDGVDIGPLDENGYVTSGSRWFTDDVLAESIFGAIGPAGTTTVLPLDQVSQLVALDTVVLRRIGEPDPSNYPPASSTEEVLTAGTDYLLSGLDLQVLIDTRPQGLGSTELIVTFRYKSGGKAWVRVRKNLGEPTGGTFDVDAAGTSLTTATGGKWSETDKLCGIPNVCVTVEFDPTGRVWASGLPQVSLIVKGAALYDPSKDSTNGGSGAHRLADPATWEWSDDAPLAWRDYLRCEVGCDATEISDASVIAALGASRTQVLTAAGSEKAFTVNGYLSTGDSWETNLETLAMSMIGNGVCIANVWHLVPFAWAAPTLTLPLSALADGNIQIDSRPGVEQSINCVRGQFLDTRPTAESPGGSYAFTDFPPRRIAAYVTEDLGREYWHDIKLPLTVGHERAQRMAQHYAYRARNALTVAATFNLDGYETIPGQRVRLPWDGGYGWNIVQDGGTGKVFQILERRYEAPGRVAMLLKEDAAAYYGWDYTTAVGVDPAPNTGLAPPNYVEPLVDVRWQSDATTFYQTPSGEIVPFVRFTWSRPANPEHRVTLNWKRAGETSWRAVPCEPGATEARAERPGAPGDVLNAYLVVYNGIGAPSDPAWIPLLPIGASAPSGRAAVVANLLQCATFDFGVGAADTWGQGLVAEDRVTFERPVESNRIPGSPTNAQVTIASSHTGQGRGAGGRFPAVPVVPGERYAVYAGLLPINTGALMVVRFYGEGDAPISQWAADRAVAALVRHFNRPESYEFNGGFVDVPQGARTARVVPFADRDWAAGVKYLGVYKPFFGRVWPGCTEFPPWTPGGTGMVDTVLLPPESITVVRETRMAGAQPVPINACDTPLLSVDVTTVGARIGDRVRYSISGQVSVPAGSTARYSSEPTLYRDALGQPKVSSRWNHLAAGERQGFSLPAGVFDYTGGKSGPTIGLYVSSDPGTATLHDAVIVTEVIKR